MRPTGLAGLVKSCTQKLLPKLIEVLGEGHSCPVLWREPVWLTILVGLDASCPKMLLASKHTGKADHRGQPVGLLMSGTREDLVRERSSHTVGSLQSQVAPGEHHCTLEMVPSVPSR